MVPIPTVINAAFPLTFTPPSKAADWEFLRCYLDQLLLALVALTDLDEQQWRQIISRLPTSGRAVVPGSAPGALDWQSLGALVLAIAQLCQQHQELLRRAVGLVEQSQAQQKNPLQTSLLGNYQQKLQQLWANYGDRHQGVEPLTETTALSLINDLFFYSTGDGAQRLGRVLENSLGSQG